MKNSAFLALMEQMVMTLVFALSAALCLQVFVLSEQMSLRSEAQSHALIITQSAAEALKGSRGNLEFCSGLLGGSMQEDSWNIHYNDQWEATDTDAAYELQVIVHPATSNCLRSATLSAQSADGDTLVTFDVSWQEVCSYE